MRKEAILYQGKGKVQVTTYKKCGMPTVYLLCVCQWCFAGEVLKACELADVYIGQDLGKFGVILLEI